MKTPEETHHPLRLVGKIVLVTVALILVAVGGTLFIRVAGQVSGVGRVVIAAAIALIIGWLGIGYFRQLTHPPPPDPTPVAVDPRLRLAYVCEMCGLELAVVMAAKDKPPKHCGEPMVLVRQENSEFR